MTITLVYPHQLFARHPAVRAGHQIWLVEDPLYFENDPDWPAAMHKQKLVLHRASMRAYAGELEAAGHDVVILEVPAGGGMDSARLLDARLPEQVTELHLADPADDVLSRRLDRLAAIRGLRLVVHSSPNFLSPDDFLARFCAPGKKPFMARFYEAQRKRMGVLLDGDGAPVGGKWSFDSDNRKRLPRHHMPPREPGVAGNSLVREAMEWVARAYPKNPGQASGFRWPVTREDAERWLDVFLDERLEFFGDYEDAISTEHATLYHAAITPALNIGLLDPADVVRKVLARDAPMNSKEGFIRQVIGWREFIHGLYRHRGADMRNGNFWGFERPMPRSFYTGRTGIPPVDRVIRRLLADGWCHHIERLMVLGNFMMLCRIRPDDVYRWFMELFVDSYDWVMVPNVYGMSQFADGGIFATKPYFSGSNYVRKMSDEPKGQWCDVWDGLFWAFIADHLEFFSSNPRLSMMARTWERFSALQQEKHRVVAEKFLASL